MKRLIVLLFALSPFLLAQSFEKDTQYNCLNTHTIKQGEKFEVKKEDALKKPLIFILKKDKLYTSRNMEFDFRMQRGGMLSYSNEDLMLLLTPGNILGIVPKKARGQLQLFFKCEKS